VGQFEKKKRDKKPKYLKCPSKKGRGGCGQSPESRRLEKRERQVCVPYDLALGKEKN